MIRGIELDIVDEVAVTVVVGHGVRLESVDNHHNYPGEEVVIWFQSVEVPLYH